MLQINKIHQGDCMELMQHIPNRSVNMILCDLPYGTTACEWDKVLPLDELWKQYKRILKEDGVVVLTASQPFTTTLIHSNKKDFKYCWYWNKVCPTGFLNAKKQPLRLVEEICIFYSKQPTYNPQMKKTGKIRKRKVNGAETTMMHKAFRCSPAAAHLKEQYFL